MAETQRKVQPLENTNETRTAQDVGELIDTDALDGPEQLRQEDALPLENETPHVFPVDDVPDSFDVAIIGELAPLQSDIEEVVASDFPEVPESFPENLTPVWIQFPNYKKGDMRGHELMYRVLIKLWNQGDHGFVNGVYSHDNDRVYPLYHDVVYAEWDEEILETPEGTVKQKVLTHWLGTDKFFTAEEVISGVYATKYPGVEFVDFATAGYDPEIFLNDDKK